MAESMRIQVRYFAMLREQRGCAEEIVVISPGSPRHLFQELQRTHAFGLDPSVLKVAINGEFAEWDDSLADNDVVVFLPPVAGG